MKRVAKAMGGRVLAVSLACVMPAAAQAGGLVGSTVNVSAFFDSTIVPWADPGDVVVQHPLVEYPQGSYPSYNSTFEVDITDTQVTIRDVLGTALPFQPSPIFNGFILEIVDGPALVSATVNPGSSLIPVAVTVAGNRVLIDFQGVTEPDFGAAIIDIEVKPSCYPDCDASDSLDIDDFICFQTLFALGDPYGDCDGDGSLAIDDFICFQTLFAVGC